MTEVLLMAVPKEFKAVVADVDRAAEYLLQEAGEERILMLVKVPETVEALVDRGVEIRALNVGGMCKRAGRSTLYRNISSSPGGERDPPAPAEARRARLCAGGAGGQGNGNRQSVIEEEGQ